MHPILRQLHTDHHHIQLLLNCLDREVDCFDYDCQRPADMALMLSAFEYFQVYPDKWHHPSEDIIFKCLLEKKTNARKVIKQVLKEHEVIVLETKEIVQSFRTVADGCIISVGELLDSAHHFITLQRTHLEKENEYIYPLIDKVFSIEEWQKIGTEIKIKSDPLFNDQSKVEYEHLYKYITELEKDK